MWSGFCGLGSVDVFWIPLGKDDFLTDAETGARAVLSDGGSSEARRSRLGTRCLSQPPPRIVHNHQITPAPTGSLQRAAIAQIAEGSRTKCAPP